VGFDVVLDNALPFKNRLDKLTANSVKEYYEYRYFLYGAAF
jgi:hypothetical protein